MNAKQYQKRPVVIEAMRMPERYPEGIEDGQLEAVIGDEA